MLSVPVSFANTNPEPETTRGRNARKLKPYKNRPKCRCKTRGVKWNLRLKALSSRAFYVHSVRKPKTSDKVGRKFGNSETIHAPKRLLGLSGIFIYPKGRKRRSMPPGGRVSADTRRSRKRCSPCTPIRLLGVCTPAIALSGAKCGADISGGKQSAY